MTRHTGRRVVEPAAAAARGRNWLATLCFLIVSEFRGRYRAQALGMVWSLLSPVAIAAETHFHLERGN